MQEDDEMVTFIAMNRYSPVAAGWKMNRFVGREKVMNLSLMRNAKGIVRRCDDRGVVVVVVVVVIAVVCVRARGGSGGGGGGQVVIVLLRLKMFLP